MGCQMGNYIDIMEVYKYLIREAFPEVTEQKDSETKLRLLRLMVYSINIKQRVRRKRKEMG